MKTKLSKLLMTGLCAFFISFATNAQENYDEILEGVKNKEKYETIDLLRMDRDLSTFANLVTLSGLNVSMELADGHTVLAPTNEAIKKMSIEKFNKLIDPDNRVMLMKFVKTHVLPNKVMSYDFKDNQVINDERRKEITISADNGIIFIGGAKVVKADIAASNGVIHIMDNVVEHTWDVLAGE